VCRTLRVVSRLDLDFEELFHRWSPHVFAYASRHVGSQQAEDVVADTFLAAWRRRSSLPEVPLPWLLVTARNTIANRRRADHRRMKLVDAVGQLERAATMRGPDTDITRRSETLAALAELSESEREAVLLTAWDGLTARDAARVAGCSTRAFEARLTRARARLSRTLDQADDEPGRNAVAERAI